MLYDEKKRKKTPPWAMRQCSFCREYAASQCDSWDKEKQNICEKPVCRRHYTVVSRIVLCPDHQFTTKPAAPPQNSATENCLKGFE